MACNTCFVLGAGFSAPAKLPVQIKILEDFSQREMRDVRTIFGAREDTKNIESVTLEDVFTFLDKIISANETAYVDSDEKEGFEVKEAYGMRQRLIEAIIKQFDSKQRRAVNIDCYKRFFDEMVRRKAAGRGETNTIVTLNWDTLPEFYINRAFKSWGGIKGGVDYGCYDWDIDEKPDCVPSILRKAKGWKTIKILKLHGSVNWVCSKRSGGLFVKEQINSHPEVFLIGDIEYERGKEYDYIIKTPTLLKDFGNVHLKMIWNNAGLDLCEAKRIVFLGYTLPAADFEFRYLLLKHVARRGKKVKVRVLIWDKEEPYKKKEIEDHFKNLFVENDLKFEYMDIEKFLVDKRLVWDW